MPELKRIIEELSTRVSKDHVIIHDRINTLLEENPSSTDIIFVAAIVALRGDACIEDFKLLIEMCDSITPADLLDLVKTALHPDIVHDTRQILKYLFSKIEELTFRRLSISRDQASKSLYIIRIIQLIYTCETIDHLDLLSSSDTLSFIYQHWRMYVSFLQQQQKKSICHQVYCDRGGIKS